MFRRKLRPCLRRGETETETARAGRRVGEEESAPQTVAAILLAYLYLLFVTSSVCAERGRSQAPTERVELKCARCEHF